MSLNVQRIKAPLSSWPRSTMRSSSAPPSIRMEGGAEDDRIVLRGHDDKGALMRWTFNDIRPDSFVWRGETSHDGGKTWRLEEEHHMTRRGRASGSTR